MATIFDVSDVVIEEPVTEEKENEAGDDTLHTPSRGKDVEAQNQYTLTSEGNLALFEEDLQRRPRISAMLASLVQYDPVAPNPLPKGKRGKKKKSAKMGTIMGVYLPTLQNILGVILFLRLPWIVGVAGVGQALLVILLCCACTLLTTISMSAIATNGVVPAGGSYFMISRNLGPEFGGAVGVLFYLANTFGTSLYTLGAIEILLTYIAPQGALFGEIQGNPGVLYNNMRIYGTILLLLMTIIVFVGVKLVNYFATFCLACVLIAVVSIYAGMFNPMMRVPVCTVDDIALQGQFECGNITNITNTTCSQANLVLQQQFINTTYYSIDNGWTEEPLCQIGIPGITVSHTIVDNTPDRYLREGEALPEQLAVGNQVRAALTTSFFVLIGIFFPSVTGIMAGSNRSGDLKDAQKSIPIGTLAAQLTTTLIYISCVLFFGATIEGFLLRDQFGDSTGALAVALLSWPTKWIVLIGALLSTIGAGLQTLTGAPRLMQAIANDNLLPLIGVFKKVSPWNGEPSLALILTACLAEIGVLIASLDQVAPILSMFYLMCYMFVNIACTLQSLLKAPNWRPRFRFYHWSTSLIGALLCVALMFMISWYYALVAMLLALGIYKYIEFRGAEREWGDGMRGLSLQAARYSLLRLEERQTHTKNWRPQVLVLVKLDENLIPAHPKLLSFASQLKAGKGLTMLASVIKGRYQDKVSEAIAAKQSLKRFVDDNKIQGFCKVVSSPCIEDGISHLIQGAGLGGMTHNTVIVGWPDSWRRTRSWDLFIATIRIATLRELAILVPKGINWYPSNQDRMKGNIDIWWIVHDGGLLMLLPFLLRQHKVWRHSKLRIFTVAQMEDNSIQMKKDLTLFLYQLRIEAEVNVIEMPDNDISAYTYQRTLIMEQRIELLKKMRLTRRESLKEAQYVLSKSFVRRASSQHGGMMPTLAEVTMADVSPANVTLDEKKEEEVEEVATVTHEREKSPPARQLSHSPRPDDGSDSDSDPEAQSVRTPLLEPPPSTAPPNQTRNLKTYDKMFTKEQLQPEEEIPLGGTAATIVQHPQEENVRRMNTSVKLNELIVTKSHSAALVIVNLPGAPSVPGDEENYMEFLDVLTEGLDRVLMVRGGGREVVTIYS